jgi:DnaJ-class molecular chaperone
MGLFLTANDLEEIDFTEACDACQGLGTHELTGAPCRTCRGTGRQPNRLGGKILELIVLHKHRGGDF